MIPGEFPCVEESGEADAYGCVEVGVVERVVESISEFDNETEEDVLREWEAFPVGVLVVQPFPAPEDAINDRVVEFGVSMFDVICADCTEEALGGLDFDSLEEVGDPMSDGLDGGGEGVVSVFLSEEFIIGDGFVVSFPCRLGEAVVEKESSFWRKIETGA